MSLLATEPPAPVRSLDELFALAEALETEAASRYAQLAQQMRAVGLVDVAEVFEHLAAEERGHSDEVTAWSRADTGHAPDPARIRWQPPTTFDEEEARSIASSMLASAYRALSMAVRNEERAFALWTYIAAQAEDPKIRAAAERMAREELRHAALLRRERRRAFHAERDRHVTGAGRPRPATEAAQVERSLSALLASLAEQYAAAAGSRAARLLDLARDAAAMANEADAATAIEAARAEAPASSTARRGDRASPSAADDPAPEGLLGALRLAERAVEDYLAAADAAQDEAVMRQLQSLAERAIARVAALRRMAGQS